jgi:protein-S-isoprenylcysteine O-methyltransferase Ste14
MRFIDLAAVSLITVYLVLGAFIEEKRMACTFEEYLKYKNEVSMFIPYKWIKKRVCKW